MQRKKAPLGIKLIAVWDGFLGVILLLLAIFGVTLLGFLSTLALADLNTQITSLVGAAAGIIFVVIGIVGVILLVVGYGLWHLKAWAWDLSFAYFVFLTASSLLHLNLFSLVIDGFLALYLWSKRKYFTGSWILKQIGAARKAM